jgi:UPF0716 protein FxsA
MWFGFILIMVAVPLLELALLIKLGQIIGFWSTVALIFATAGIGIAILNAQGFAAFRRASESIAKGQPPVEPVLDGFMLMMAGGLLIAPGLLTDIAGLLLLVPPVRRLVAKWGLKRMMANGNIHVSTWQSETRFEEVRPEAGHAPMQRHPNSAGPVIDGEFERVDDPPAPSNRVGKVTTCKPGDDPARKA